MKIINNKNYRDDGVKCCSEEFECRGNCWLNVAGDCRAWEYVANKCDGTKEEQQLINDIFNKGEKVEKLFNKYDFTEKEKKYLSQGLM